ncbi:hypothetical protein CEXT_143911 [Caerostris extrusa]|uniref:PDEase domain-containing protein n=1 Tax=Caerostris extrusa TaxID=172846 RepID=A0AAV4MWA4_CAEEX|nr:hypothetical protein CEXT_143911 [Caerostris extrusa]
MPNYFFGRFPMTELCYFLTALKANYQHLGTTTTPRPQPCAVHVLDTQKTPGVFTELEMKSLMIASLAHDVAHPGLNDVYLKKSPLHPRYHV